MSELLKLAEACEKAEGPSRELDAQIMFDLYAKPVGKHKKDGGPIGYLWPEDNASWSFGIRFPGRDRAWFGKTRAKTEHETLLIERDNALVLMNSLRVPKLTASIDAALTLVPDGHDISIVQASGPGRTDWSARCDERRESGSPCSARGEAATPALALCAAALKARTRAEGEE